MEVKEEIAASLKMVLKELKIEGVKPSVDMSDLAHGDYTSNIAMAIFSNSKIQVKSQKFRSPLELAQKIIDRIKNQESRIKNIERIEAVAPGFINFWLSEDYLFSQLKQILEQKEKFGSKKEDPNKKVVVEFSSPNIAKPFTVGHLRSTIIGNAISNLSRVNGWKVYRDNHLGDWGTQFGKQIAAIKKWGDEEKISKSENPVKELVALYVKFHQEVEKDPSLEEEAREWFKKLENKDVEARRLWRKCVDWSLKEFQRIYQVLDIKFTENKGIGYGESFFEDKMGTVIKELEDKRLLKESEGAKLIFFKGDKYPPLMILKQDGATLYATRDLATDRFRLQKYGKDIVVINEVGAEQSLYFKQLFEVEKMLGWYKEGQRVHVKHGLYRFKDKKMSTRKGNTIWLEDVLGEAIKRAKGLGSEGEQVAEKVGIGALKWNDLKRSSSLDIVFDWDEILNMQGNSGPYIQYTYARTRSVLRKARNTKIKFKIQNSKPEPEELSLLRTIYRFSEKVESAGEGFVPNILCGYLFDLAQRFNLFYQKHKILAADSSADAIGKQEFRIALTQSVGQVLKNGLNLLGIEAPEKM